MRIQRTLRISTAPAGAVGFGGALTLLEFARTIGGGVEFFWLMRSAEPGSPSIR